MKIPIYVTAVCAILLLLPGCGKTDAVAANTVVEVTMTESAAHEADAVPVTKTAEVLIGHQQTSPVIESALMGMRAGEIKKFELKANDGPYGGYNPYAVQDVPKSLIPKNQEIGVGAAFAAGTPALAAPTSARIIAVNENGITVDFNHPLAGKDLLIGLEVRSIRPATREELDRVGSTGQVRSEP